MVYRSVIILTILLSCDNKNKDNVFRWEGIERAMSNEERQKILTLLHDPIVEGFNKQALESESLEIYELFHFVDVNNDGHDDIVYNGFGGAAEEFIMVFLNNEAGGYRKVLHHYGHITSLKTDSDNMLNIKVPEMVGDDSGDSVLIFKVVKDSIMKKSSKIIR